MSNLKGGDKLLAKLAELAKMAENPATLRVGFLSESSYPDGTPVALVAAVQEFGAPSIGIPARPFFRTMIADKSGEWPKAIADLLKANDFDAARTLELAGQAIAGQLRESITSFVGTPLKPATIARKGSSKQLVDTGHMLASVDYEVETK